MVSLMAIAISHQVSPTPNSQPNPPNVTPSPTCTSTCVWLHGDIRATRTDQRARTAELPLSFHWGVDQTKALGCLVLQGPGCTTFTLHGPGMSFSLLPCLTARSRQPRGGVMLHPCYATNFARGLVRVSVICNGCQSIGPVRIGVCKGVNSGVRRYRHAFLLACSHGLA